VYSPTKTEFGFETEGTKLDLWGFLLPAFVPIQFRFTSPEWSIEKKELRKRAICAKNL
jgi:hypothetical protein